MSSTMRETPGWKSPKRMVFIGPPPSLTELANRKSTSFRSSTTRSGPTRVKARYWGEPVKAIATSVAPSAAPIRTSVAARRGPPQAAEAIISAAIAKRSKGPTRRMFSFPPEARIVDICLSIWDINENQSWRGAFTKNRPVYSVIVNFVHDGLLCSFRTVHGRSRDGAFRPLAEAGIIRLGLCRAPNRERGRRSSCFGPLVAIRSFAPWVCAPCLLLGSPRRSGTYEFRRVAGPCDSLATSARPRPNPGKRMTLSDSLVNNIAPQVAPQAGFAGGDLEISASWRNIC